MVLLRFDGQLVLGDGTVQQALGFAHVQRWVQFGLLCGVVLGGLAHVQDLDQIPYSHRDGVGPFGIVVFVYNQNIVHLGAVLFVGLFVPVTVGVVFVASCGTITVGTFGRRRDRRLPADAR